MIKNKYIAIMVMLMFAMTMLSPAAYAHNFSDINGHWAEDQIQSMTDEGIISGYPEGTFQPDGKITRAEFASLLVTAFGLTKGEGKSFTDTVDHWAKEAIAAANAAGIVNGYSDTIFGPDDPITREQMAVMIVKAARLTDAANAKTFADSSFISDWAKEAVDIATSNQLISGYPDNTFQPQGNATRAEAAAVLSGLLKKTTPPEKPAEKVEEEQEEDTVIEQPVVSAGGGGGGGGGGSIIKVSAISVKGTGDATAITTDKGTLQMIAAVEPDNASSKAVAWSVDDETIAIISSTGLLTARANGIVTVTATAKDGSGVKDTAVIKISGQTITPPLSSAKAITSFIFDGCSLVEEINESAKKIDLTVPYATDVTALAATFTLSDKASAKVGETVQASGITVNDFTNPVKYTVTAEDGSSVNYTVIVTIVPANSFILKYTAGSGGTITGTLSQIVESGKDGTAVTAVADEGYSFVKWSDDVTTAARKDTNITENIKVTAEFKIKEYTVTFKDYDDSVLKTETVQHGKAATSPAVPIRDGYIFTGWDKAFNNVTSNLDVTAQWEAEVLGTISPILSAGDKKVVLTAMSEAGYDFYYKTTSSTDETNKPTVNSAVLTDWTKFTIDTEIDAENEVVIFVQVIKAAEGKIKAWGEASATPKSGIIEVGFESLTANGESGKTTTNTLYVKFDREIYSLNLDNFLVEGATATLLNMSSTASDCSIAIKDITVKNGQEVKVTIYREGYLFAPTSKEVAVYVQNVQASIDPNLANFDKLNPEDIKTTISFGTATRIESIKKVDTALTEGTDYTVSDNTLTIKKEYLAAQPKGSTVLTIAFDQGNTRDLRIDITNEAIYNITVAEITGGFGGETAAAYGQFNALINTAKEGEHVTIAITELSGTIKAWKVKSATIEDADGHITDIAGTSSKIVHGFTMPASDVTVFIELEPEADSTPPTVADSEITADYITDISVALGWNKATDNLTPIDFLRYYVYRSPSNNISTVEDAEKNGELLNEEGTYNIASCNLTNLVPANTYYTNIVVSDYAGNKTAYTMKEVTTFKAVTDLDLTTKVTRPVKYASIDRVFEAGKQYTADAIRWYKKIGDEETIVYGSGNFEAGTIYVAEVTLTVKEGYSFNNDTVFTYTDAPSVSFEKIANNNAAKGTVTITFPATEAAIKYALTLDGEGLTSDPPGNQIAENTKLTITAAPEEGEQVNTFTVNGENKITELKDNKYTFTITEDTIIAVTYTGEYALISSGDDVVEFKVNDSPVTTAKKGDTVTMTVTPGDEGEELIGAVIKGISKDEVTEETTGEQFTFTMPAADVDVKVTVGMPNKKLNINEGHIGFGYITLTNGQLKNNNNDDIGGLSWSYFTNTLTMDGFEGSYLGFVQGNDFGFDLELINENSISSTNSEAALRPRGIVTIKGKGTLNIKNTGQGVGIGFNSRSTLILEDNVKVNITTAKSEKGGVNFTHSVNIKDDAQLTINSTQDNLDNVTITGVTNSSDGIVLEGNGKVDVTVENKRGGTAAISDGIPYIGNGAAAYKGTAAWSASCGTIEKPIEISCHVPDSADLFGKNIRLGADGVADLWANGFNETSIAPEDKIVFVDGIATLYAQHGEKHYKISLEEYAATLVTGVSLDKVELSLEIGESETLTATVTPADAANKNVSWKSSANDIAIVDNYGKVTAIKPGTAVITVTTENEGKTATCEVRVIDQSAAIGNVEIKGKTGQPIEDKEVVITLAGTTFNEISKDEDLASWFVGFPPGLTAKAKETVNDGANSIQIHVGGTPKSAIEKEISIKIPADKLASNRDLEVTPNENAIYNFPKYINVSGTEYELNGEESLPAGLTWDAAENILTMKNYEGGYIKYSNFQEMTIRIDGSNKITAAAEALNFNNLTILGSNKAADILTIQVAGSTSRAIHRYCTIKNVTVDVDFESSNNSNPIVAVSDNVTVDAGLLKLNIKANATTTSGVYGMGGNYFELDNGGAVNIKVASTEYPNKVSIASTTPYITDAYEVTAELTANEGTAASPYEVYVKVPETVAEIKKNNIGIMSGQYELFEDETFTEKITDENWQVSWDAEDRGVVYAWAKDLLGEKYYIVTIQRDPADTP